MDKIYAVIPAYNEQDNIREVINDWYPVIMATGPESRLVIIDDGSKDDTFDILCDEAHKRPGLIALSKPNSGHGATLLYGYRYAISQGADFIFQTDSDGQTLASEFEGFYKRRNDYDIVIGHRKGRQDGFSRLVVTKTLKAVVRLMFGVKITDANTPYRLMKAEPLKDCLSVVPDNFNLTNVVLSVAFARFAYKGAFVPVTFRPRQGGKNSINIPKIIKIGFRALRDFRSINKEINNECKKRKQ